MPKATMSLRGRRNHRHSLKGVMGRAHMGAPRAKRSGDAQPGAERH